MKFENYVFHDRITVGDEELEIQFIPEKVAPTYYTLLKAISEAEKSLKTPEEVNTYAELIVRLMSLIYGPEVTEKMVNYYGENMNGMIDDVTFYLAVKIAPVMREFSKAKEKRLKQKNKELRRLSWRAWFGRW